MLSELHIEYYDEIMNYMDEFNQFKKEYNPKDFIKNKNNENSDNEESMVQKKKMLPRVLIKDTSQQFGSKAPEKLSRLLFMIRENKDVFEVFVNKLPEMILSNPSSDYISPIVNFMFNDLVSSHFNKKLFYVSY